MNLNEPISALPKGWKKEEFVRSNGLSNGNSIIRYIGPNGQVARTPRELQAQIGQKFDTSSFDWQNGKFITHGQKMRRTQVSIETHSKGLTPYTRLKPNPNDTSIKPKVIRTFEDSRRNDDVNKASSQDFPHQLFWEKRFNNLGVIDASSGEKFPQLRLPNKIQSAGFIGINEDHVLLSLINAISNRNNLITGQNAQTVAIEKNPCVAILPNQPLIKGYVVTDDDIKKQEQKVKELRSKLQLARKRLNQIYTMETEG